MQLHTADLDWITSDAEKVIARHARVSTKDPDRAEYEKLLTYCIKHSHWSVFEQASASFEISTTRAISPQILRHRSFVFQEACITGDSLISFELPHGHTKNKRSHYTRSISYLYDKFHFGAAPINSRWDSEDKRRIPLKDRIQNMRIRVFDQNTNEFITSNIVDIYKTGVKPCYEIKFSNGKKIKSTLDHKFLTKSGFAPLKEILDLRVTSNNTVAIPIERADTLFATNGVPVYQDKDWLQKTKEICIANGTGLEGIANAASCSPNTIRKWLKKHSICFTKKEVASYTPIWNKGLRYKGKPMSEETKDKLRAKARRGSDSNLWRGGVDRAERQKICDFISQHRRKLLEDACFKCKKCGSNKKLELHHRLPVYSHPDKAYDLSNIEVLCKECHSRTHGTEGHRVEWRHRSSGNKLTARWTTVESITYLGLLDTYDLEVDHDSHNYVANGVVVHNSQRYCNPNETLDVEEKPFQFELRFQAQKNRQSSVDRLPVYMCESFWDRLEIIDSQIQELYNEMLNAGVARECARNILPLYTPTRMHMSGTVRSFIHYVGLRGKDDTQKEHREIARSIGYRLARELPTVVKAIKQSEDPSLKGWDFIRYLPQ
jgi:thymidylate synthase (FAD)